MTEVMSWRIVNADVIDGLCALPDASVQTVVTSPPYWGLRDYGIDSQLGLESTPEEYTERMVAVFREVRRVLRDDGTVWLNLGDSYARNGGDGDHGPNAQVGNTLQGNVQRRMMRVPAAGRGGQGLSPNEPGAAETERPVAGALRLKPKDLVGIPWRVAFALQADGWYLRSDIVWAKPNPMPESVTDRPTKAHEYVFLLSKSARYFYDADAVREPISPSMLAAIERGPREAPANGYQHDAHNRFGKTSGNRAFSDADSLERIRGGRNLRSVWSIATEPFPAAHFATFPKALVEPCVKAGTSERGCCATCGEPYVRVTEREPGDGPLRSHGTHPGPKHLQGPASRLNSGTAEQYHANRDRTRTLGWRPTCRCGAGSGNHTSVGGNSRGMPPSLEPVPCTVLDPFAGSGTTGVVALRLGRSFVGIELNATYAEMARNRIRDDAPLFNLESEVVSEQT